MPAGAGHQVRALVVDDVLENRKVLSTMLRMAGCQTPWPKTAGGRSRRSRVPARHRLHGLAAARTWTGSRRRGRSVDGTRPARIPVVATSASVLDGERERCLAAGCDEFVAKPFRADQIYACVAGLLDVSSRSSAAASQPVSDASVTDLAPIALPEHLAARTESAPRSCTAPRRSGAACTSSKASAPTAVRLADHLRGFLASCDMDAIHGIVAHAFPRHPQRVHTP